MISPVHRRIGEALPTAHEQLPQLDLESVVVGLRGKEPYRVEVIVEQSNAALSIPYSIHQQSGSSTVRGHPMKSQSTVIGSSSVFVSMSMAQPLHSSPSRCGSWQ